MSIADYFAEQTGNNLPDDLRVAMRHMAGGVSVITAGTGDERTGLTAITARSLSIEPPRMLICVSSTASTWPVIRKYRHFAVNILRADQQAVAERFAGRKGEKGVQRYLGADWVQLASGASGLADATARLEGVEGIAMVRFTAGDVVRHPIVGRIVEAYEGAEA